ncbi:MAG: hypothetical protein R6X12_10540 [bacterium]
MSRRMILLVLAAVVAVATAQHEHHERQGAGMPAAVDGGLLPGVPMTRDGSGTAWLPDAAPVSAVHGRAANLDLMLHYSGFARFTSQDVLRRGTRGASRLDGPNWLMGMAGMPVGRAGRLSGRTMLSLDPLTVGGAGYPLLFQSGETWQGRELVDRQHPHDFLGELALAYGRALGADAGLFAYAGLPGEPAFGPPAFIHRPSAGDNPAAPLGHHLQDATHIIFGVATIGARLRQFKLDASLFTGREPDENRWNIDRPRFDSWSGRLSWNPGEAWALQVSHAFARSPEPGHEDVDVRKTTASALFSRRFGRERTLSAALVFGRNDPTEGPGLSSLLVEAAVAGRFGGHLRAELLQRTASELDLDGEHGHDVHLVSALTLGGSVAVLRAVSSALRVGAQATVNFVGPALRAEYGRLPLSVDVFLRVTPGEPAAAHGRSGA